MHHRGNVLAVGVLANSISRHVATLDGGAVQIDLMITFNRVFAMARSINTSVQSRARNPASLQAPVRQSDAEKPQALVARRMGRLSRSTMQTRAARPEP